MKYLVEQIDKQNNEQLIYTLKLEIDYELLTLYDAIQENDRTTIEATKEKLHQLVKNLYIVSYTQVNIDNKVIK